MYDHQTCTLGFTYNMKKRTARFLFSRKLESNFEVRLTHETTREPSSYSVYIIRYQLVI